jgi:HlyD family secretion protein
MIIADFDGRIETLELHNGQHVKAGQIVAHLDDSELQSKLASAKARKASADASGGKAYATYANAARKAANAERLVHIGAGTPEDAKNAAAEAKAASAEGGVAASSAKEAIAEIELDQKLIASADVKAPIDGVVSVVKKKEGELARKGDAIARVFDPDALVIRFAVPTSRKDILKPGTPIQLVTAEGRTVSATVQRPDDDLDPSIDFKVYEAAIDPNFRIDEIRVGDNGHVRIAAAQGASR